ncbi:MAG TPA: CidA/LrgA family protein [Myxococcales bacterium]|nr:CidA/LrgA family protein [Myxococcales bacterium]
MVTALTLLLCCQLAGEFSARVLGLPIPGPVLGMLLLFALLLGRSRILEPVREPSYALLRHLSLLFVPAGVGLIRHTGRLRAELWPILVAVVISTAATVAVTALVFQLVAGAGKGER